MLYGERLKLAMEKRSKELGREVTRKEIAAIAGRTVQNIGMILTNAQGEDQTLAAVAHARVSRFLRVSSDWLLEEIGDMEPAAPGADSTMSQAAELFDTIPASDRLGRIKAFNEATTAIMKVLQSSGATGS